MSEEDHREEEVEKLQQFWRERISHWYPHLLHAAHFLPAVFMNRTRYRTETQAGQTVYVPQVPLSNLPRGDRSSFREDEAREDQALQCVLACLRDIAGTRTPWEEDVHPQPEHVQAEALPKQVMFVISQLKYVNYLKDVPEHLRGLLPTPKDMEKENQHRGDFDLLIIHRYHGLFACEVKAVGDKLAGNTESETNEIISKKIVRALEQLRKAEKVLRHLVSLHEPPPRVNKCLMLPNLTRDVLSRVLGVFPQLEQNLRDCLQAGTHVDVRDLVMTSNTLQNTPQWWQLLMEVTGPDDVMSDQLYLDLVSRFGGPATTIDLFCPAVPRLGHDGSGCSGGGSRGEVCRSLGEAVAETSWRFTHLVLHPRQLDILREDPPLLFITGPPGTGKTTVLVLKALEWLRSGHDVHVLSTWAESLSASSFIVAQLKQTEPKARDRVHMHEFYLWKREAEDSVDKAVTRLAQCARDGVLHIVTDEMAPDSFHPKRRFSMLCSRLVQSALRSVRIWAASIYHKDRPDILREFTITEPLRTPDAITQEVAKWSRMGGPERDVLGYTSSSSPLPCRGVPPWEVLHRDEDHGEVTVVADCEQCGREVARVLREELRVGAAGTDSTARNSQKTSTGRPLRYKDALLLVRLGDLTRTEEDSEGNSHHVDCGLVRGLQAGGVPVRVLSQYHDDVVTMAGPDAVLVTWSNIMVGLERTVVVWPYYDEPGLEWGRILAMPRCTGQLVVVKKAE